MFVWIIFGFAAIIGVYGVQEVHVVSFVNNCGFGTPTLIQSGNTLSQGSDYTVYGPLVAAIAYLQTGNCGLNGEGCTLIEATLVNPGAPGSGSSADISLISPHAFSVKSGFNFAGGCTNGATCDNAACPTAFKNPDDTFVQEACQSDNANLVITFC